MKRKVRVTLPPMDAEQLDRLIEVLDLTSAALWTQLVGPEAPHRVEVTDFRRQADGCLKEQAAANLPPLDTDIF